MPPRAYNSETRKQQQAGLRARIAAAAAQLHAEKGVLGTTYSDIALRAGVSLPTVYNHFPTRDHLIPACTAHVASRAPALPVELILSAGNLDSSAAAMVDAVERLHAYAEPWASWGESRLVPALKEVMDARRKRLADVVGQLLELHLGPGDHRDTIAIWESLLSFDMWHRLARDHKMPRATVRRALHQLLLAGAGSWPAASPSRPAPRKSKCSPSPPRST
ncbi:MAG TPA: TetR/AcrR family transcriptional regulator [Ramlibacter sp.]|nr:TetR/AcrR family transcriptional regulator [Ramlibacter sp.]